MVSVIIMMAGSGSRMNINQNKVYLELGGKMIFEHSLDKFCKYADEIICVIRKEDEHYFQKHHKIKIAYGGATRQESVRNGLLIASGDYVLIHDGARPFIKEETIQKCIESLKDNNAVLVGYSSKDSIYEKKPFHMLSRENLFNAQTPQGAKRNVLINCHQMAVKNNDITTDDISLILKYSNEKVELVDGTDCNFKITTQLDYILAKELVK